MTVSKNGVAVAVLIIESLLTALGVEFEPGSMARMIEGVVMLAALLLAVWNQVDREDVVGFLFKKG